jgi:hypothetical protein
LEGNNNNSITAKENKIGKTNCSTILKKKEVGKTCTLDCNGI